MADSPFSPSDRIYVSPNKLPVGQSVTNGNTASNSNLNKPYFDIASLSPSGPNPARALDGPNPNGVNKILRFPSDTPPYYMVLAVNKYSRASWISVGQLSEESRVILPLPREMIDNHNVRYAVEDIGFSGAVGFDAIAGNAQAAAAEAAAGAAIAGARGTVGRLLGPTGGQIAGGVTKGALAASGLAVNDFMTVMLKGPDYKRRDFLWRFAPKSAQETSDLRRIIQVLNNAMAPSITANIGSAFFTWPRIFQPSFVYNGQADLLALNTFRMKPSVMTDFSVNYTPNGTFSPFASTKAPSSVDVRMTFLELEFWLTGQFDDIQQSGTSSDNNIDQLLGRIESGIGNVAGRISESINNSGGGG